MQFSKPGGYRINKLVDEIDAANIAGLIPVAPRPGRPVQAQYSVTPLSPTIISQGVYGTIDITFVNPNAVDVGALQSVINAHSPTAVINPDDNPPPTLSQAQKDAILSQTVLSGAQQALFNKYVFLALRFIIKRLTGNPEAAG